MLHQLGKYFVFGPLAIALTLAGCSDKGSQVQTSANSEGESTASPSVSEYRLFAKKLPVLGTSSQQMADEATVLQAALSGKTAEIPKTSSAGVTPNPIAVLKGYPPEGTDVCNLPYSALTKAIYDSCINEGMSYIDVANTVGFEGQEQARAGDSVTYRWGASEGSMSAFFTDGKLVSKN